MTEEQLKKHYSKKPKDILVIDCMYFDGQLKSYKDQLQTKERELNEANRRLSDALARVNCLAHVNGKLLDAAASLRDGVLIGR